MSEAAGVEQSLFTKVGPLPAWLWGVLIVGGYFAYEHFSSSSDTSATGTDTAADDTTDDGSGDYGDTGYTDGYVPEDATDLGTDTTGEYTGASQVSGIATYATNQQWLIGAINSLRAQGYPAGPVTTALTLYIQGKRITAQDATYVNAAIQSIGPPPEPRPINTGSTTTGSTGSGTGTKTTTAVPKAPQIAAGRVTKTSITIKWPSVPGAVNYQVVAGSKVHLQKGRSYTLTGLHSGTSHQFYVRARNSHGVLGPESNHLTVKTK